MTIRLVAQSSHWNTSTITVPANKTWTVVVDNEDSGVRHNFEFSSPTFPGYGPISFFIGVDTRTAVVPGLPAGTYTFVCIVHPDTMTGTLTIK